MTDTHQVLLGAIRYERGVDVNRMLRAIADQLRTRGIATAGVVQHNQAPEKGYNAQMNLIDLRTGSAVAISQDLGPHAQGCRLDQSRLLEAAGIIGAAIEAGSDLIIINRFGKAEAEGEGLLSSITEAIIARVPVLTTVRPPYLEAWHKFHGGLATELPPSEPAVLDWCETAMGRSPRPNA